jgi:hypothetical protein
MAVHLGELEELVDAISEKCSAINYAWAQYDEAARLTPGLRRKDIGDNVLRFNGQLEGIVIDRLRLVLNDDKRPFASRVPPTQALGDVGKQLRATIEGAIAAHTTQVQRHLAGG